MSKIYKYPVLFTYRIQERKSARYNGAEVMYSCDKSEILYTSYTGVDRHAHRMTNAS